MMNGYGLFSGVVGIGMIIALSGTLVVADAKDKGGVLKASELIGMKVQGSDGKNVGKIRDLVIGPDGDVRYAVLDFGGFLGIGDKYFAVPWDALQRTKNGKKIALDTTKRDLKKAPGFQLTFDWTPKSVSITGGGKIPVQQSFGPLAISALSIDIRKDSLSIALDLSFQLSFITVVPYELGLKFAFDGSGISPFATGGSKAIVRSTTTRRGGPRDSD